MIDTSTTLSAVLAGGLVLKAGDAALRVTVVPITFLPFPANPFGTAYIIGTTVGGKTQKVGDASLSVTYPTMSFYQFPANPFSTSYVSSLTPVAGKPTKQLKEDANALKIAPSSQPLAPPLASISVYGYWN